VYYIPAHLKDMNRQVIYQIVSAGGATSRAQIARDSGISLPTVNKVIKYFTEIGIVNETDEVIAQGSRLGRRPQVIRFNAESFFAIGVEYEGGSIRVGIVDLSGAVKALRTADAPAGLGIETAAVIVDLVNEVIKSERIDRKVLLGVGIGVPGVVDIEQRTVAAGPMVGVFAPTSLNPLAAVIEKKLGLPVSFENDVNAAAIGEYTVRGGGAKTDLVFMSLGTGFGGGIILDGQLWRGKRNFAGEFGYLNFDEHATSRVSDAGWLEARIGLKAPVPPDPGFVARQLALGIANIATVLGVDQFVVGGAALSRYGSGFVSSIGEAVHAYTDQPITVEPALCDEPGVVGAASLVIASTLNERWQD
jgi:predicted NBD/HSP70 family sugar kinase